MSDREPIYDYNLVSQAISAAIEKELLRILRLIAAENYPGRDPEVYRTVTRIIIRIASGEEA